MGFGRWFICQYDVAAGASDGDSGAPVFEMLGGGKVKLHGMLHGGHVDSIFVFSTMMGIESDFGGYLDVMVDPPTVPGGLVIDGPTEIKPNAECLWEGSAASGTTPFAFTWEISGIGVSNTYQYIGGKPGWVTGSSFVLKLTVINDAGSTSTQITVTENASALDCIM
jgi:hypothetical protein